MASTLGTLNPLRYRGYVYDEETGLYYLQSRYYNPTWGRFLTADSLAFLGADGTPLSYNLFAYCGNNPVNCSDPLGNCACAAGGLKNNYAYANMCTSCGYASSFAGGVVTFYAFTWIVDIFDSFTRIKVNEISVTYSSPTLYNDDDDYYNNDDNFGGRQKIGKPKGNTPGNNQKQNKQFRDATRDLTSEQKRLLHDKISGKNLSFHEIIEAKRILFNTIIGLYDDFS